MQFIEIQEGLSVKVDSIESIQFNPENGGSKITMKSGAVHETAFQHIQLLQLIEIEENVEKKLGQGSRLEGQFHNG